MENRGKNELDHEGGLTKLMTAQQLREERRRLRT